MAQALVPMKDLVQAKTRLAGLLRPSERRALAQAMVEDVLAVAGGHPQISRVTLVSDDPCAGLLASKYHSDCWSEAYLGAHGLNAVVQRASERLMAEVDEPLLVMHGDLPLLTRADISAVLACQQRLRGLVIGCDQRGSGTNMLAFDRASVPRFCFGVDSCARHLAAARGAGIAAQVLQRSGIATDVDEARDLATVMAELNQDSVGETAGLLCDTQLGARIELALATLGHDRGQTDEGKAS